MSLRRYSLILLAAASVVLVGCPGQHNQGVVEVMTDDCATCHGTEAASVTDPPHLGNFPGTCFECHNTSAWKPAFFTHANLVSSCYDCHRADYEQGGIDPPHVNNLPQTCEDCHTTDAWTPATFSHDKVIGACYDCHRLDYERGGIDPPHVNNLPQTCEDCHTTDVWTPATFSHDKVIGACYNCHRPDYEGTVNPSHVQGGYPQTCGDCHTTDRWIPALDGIHPELSFPITNGPHKPFACLECHNANLGSSIGGVNTDCVGCHTGQHARQKVDDQHSGVIDYVFDTTNPHFCLQCHPNGLK